MADAQNKFQVNMRIPIDEISKAITSAGGVGAAAAVQKAAVKTYLDSQGWVDALSDHLVFGNTQAQKGHLSLSVDW